MRNSSSAVRNPDSVHARPVARVRRYLADDRGVAALEAVLVLLLLVGVLFAVVLLGQWGTRLQYSQMGARLLAFDAGDATIAKNGRPGDSAVQTFSSGSWDPYAGTLPIGWLNMMFVLPNQRFCGRVSGVQSGRLPGQSPSLFDFSPAALGYSAGACAATNPWSDSGDAVQSQFLGIAYYVGRYRTGPQGLNEVPSIPPGIPLVETILGRVDGVR